MLAAVASRPATSLQQPRAGWACVGRGWPRERGAGLAGRRRGAGWPAVLGAGAATRGAGGGGARLVGSTGVLGGQAVAV